MYLCVHLNVAFMKWSIYCMTMDGIESERCQQLGVTLYVNSMCTVVSTYQTRRNRIRLMEAFETFVLVTNSAFMSV